MRRRDSLLALVPAALLAGCGDSLEDRNAALSHEQLRSDARETRIVTERPSAPDDSLVAAPEDARAPVQVDADDEALLADTQGFAAEPMDDASGMAPEAIAPERYVPETFVPESFTD